MNCMSCQCKVPPVDVVFFLSTFLCKPCASSANEFRDRAKAEILSMLAYLDFAVQQGIKDPTISMMGELSKDLPQFSVARMAANLCVLLQEKSCQQKSPKELTPSITSSSPSVPGLGALEPKSLPSL